MIPKPFKEIKKFNLIENGKVNYYFKITFLNDTTKVFDNNGNEIPKSKLTNNNNNKEQKNGKVCEIKTLQPKN